jgi:hypothetical protein
MDLDQFILRNYELQVRYLSDHFSRMWTRFNFFLTINSALFGFSFNASYEVNVQYIIIAGIVFSSLWVYFGGVDNWLVDAYRGQVQTGFSAIKKALQRSGAGSGEASDRQEHELWQELRSVGTTDVCNTRMGLWSFRWKWISATDLATVFPIMFVFAWITRLWLAG